MSQVNLRRISIFCTLAIASFAFGDLQNEVRKIVSRTDLHKGNAGIYIIDTSTGEAIVDIDANDGMIPASNQKLLTSGAALHILGSDFAYRTQLFYHEDDLILVGDGDPTFGDMELAGLTDWGTERQMLAEEIKPWVKAVFDTGVKEIETLWVDDRIFDQNFIHPSWPSDQINNWYCAQVSGLNYHLNVFHFFPYPNKGTTASLGSYTPVMPWVTINNRTSSKTGKGNNSSFWVARSPNSNKITTRGNVKSKHTVPVKVAFHDPAIVLGETLAATLRLNGISVGEVKRVPETNQASTEYLGSGAELLFLRETPIAHVLKRSNRDSHNLYAESLLKRLSASATGRSGTFDEGAKAVANIVAQRLGSVQRGLSPSDGSGMSRKNSVSPKTLTRWLASFQLSEPVGKAFLESLATPGNGTLRTRFKKVPLEGATVHAKSGYILGVSSLSGYIVFDNGREPIVFSIIVNNVKGSIKNAKAMQEQIIAITIQTLLN